jgi:hypothetical protein
VRADAAYFVGRRPQQQAPALAELAAAEAVFGYSFIVTDLDHVPIGAAPISIDDGTVRSRSWTA